MNVVALGADTTRSGWLAVLRNLGCCRPRQSRGLQRRSAKLPSPINFGFFSARLPSRPAAGVYRVTRDPDDSARSKSARLRSIAFLL